MNEPFLIWGAGAIGGTVGAYLLRAGFAAHFVDIDEAHVNAINRDGIAIEGPIDTFRIPARASLPEHLEGRFGRILLCVKAQHTPGATEALLPHLADDGYVASFQNGLNEYVIGARVGLDRVIGAFLNFGADYCAPGRVSFGGRGAVVLGELDGSRTPRLLALHAAVRAFEPAAVVTDNIVGFLWGKLGYGALLFATALTDDPIADVLAGTAHAPLLTAIAGEVIAVADRLGVDAAGFDGFDPAAFRMGGQPAGSLTAMAAHNRRSAKTHSGIWRDLAIRKRPTEVDAQLGAVTDAARSHGVATPLVGRLVAMIHEVERGERPQQRGNLAELAAHA